MALPGQSDLVGTDSVTSQSVVIDESAFDKDGKLNVDSLLQSKLQ